MGVITFSGVASDTLGLVVERPPDYVIPQRDYEVIHIPGRNGDYILDNGSYQNVVRSYDIAFGVDVDRDSFYEAAIRVAQWLHGYSGYRRLSDSYEPNYYRMAYYEEETDIINILTYAGRATINFVCKPQRFYTSGETSISFTRGSNKTITNPSAFASYPKIEVSCADVSSSTAIVSISKANVAQYLVSITGFSGEKTVVIDSATQEIYFKADSSNASGYVTLSNGFPVIEPGQNTMTASASSSGISSAKLYPNWWTL